MVRRNGKRKANRVWEKHEISKRGIARACFLHARWSMAQYRRSDMCVMTIQSAAGNIESVSEISPSGHCRPNGIRGMQAMWANKNTYRVHGALKHAVRSSTYGDIRPDNYIKHGCARGSPLVKYVFNKEESMVLILLIYFACLLNVQNLLSKINYI